MINFEDTKTAFTIKSDRDLRRAYILFKLISYPILVKIAKWKSVKCEWRDARIVQKSVKVVCSPVVAHNLTGGTFGQP